jgi:hypothetical protein
MPNTIDHNLDLQDAVNWATNWRRANPGSNKAFLVDFSEVTSIQAETGATSFRVYFGLDSTGAEKLILVGVDSNGNDIINPVVNGHQESGTYDFNMPCPPTCDPGSPLMTGTMPPPG